MFAAISPGIIAFSLYTKVQRYLGASLTGFTLYLFAIYGAIFGIILFEEMLLPFHYYGGALVFAGVYIARKNKNNMKYIYILISSALVIYLILLTLIYVNQRKITLSSS